MLGGVLVGTGAALALRYLARGLDLFLFPLVAAPLVVAGHHPLRPPGTGPRAPAGW